MKSLLPAYGRDYKNAKEITAALADPKVDWEVVDIMSGGGYTTGQELANAGETKVLVRYRGKRQQGVFGLPPAVKG